MVSMEETNVRLERLLVLKGKIAEDRRELAEAIARERDMLFLLQYARIVAAQIEYLEAQQPQQ
jgi:hypothetical protein